MKIVYELVPEQPLERFADAHGLVMKVTERSGLYVSDRLPRFMAQFAGCEIGGDGMLQSAYGNGNTPSEAIADYAPQISEKTLIVDAMKPTRRTIKVPRLLVGTGNHVSTGTCGSLRSEAQKKDPSHP